MTQQEANQITQFIQGLVGGTPATQQDAGGPVHCNEHGDVMEKGVSKTKFNNDGSPKTYLFHKVDGKMCFGKGIVGS